MTFGPGSFFRTTHPHPPTPDRREISFRTYMVTNTHPTSTTGLFSLDPDSKHEGDVGIWSQRLGTMGPQSQKCRHFTHTGLGERSGVSVQPVYQFTQPFHL